MHERWQRVYRYQSRFADSLRVARYTPRAPSGVPDRGAGAFACAKGIYRQEPVNDSRCGPESAKGLATSCLAAATTFAVASRPVGTNMQRYPTLPATVRVHTHSAMLIAPWGVTKKNEIVRFR
jgi:hypothetical protein